MAVDEHSRARLDEHEKRMDRHETLLDRLFSAMDLMSQWRAKTTVYVLIGTALVSWLAFHVLETAYAGAING